MEIKYKPSFLRNFKKLSSDVQTEAKFKISLFTNPVNHEQLKVHSLKGKLKDFQSFSVTYSHRIVFQYESANTVVFMSIGTHDIYK
ncbi:type II toxin-antitoxin system mRNA interferase toxin, RelE/StbE family [Candidatus Kaiserbacteria bacterium CG_4_8_14_3_um_filter_38_9]|uniref:Type II toxin-antitoxin system mRNA interferase toxin, RelE/StbE family n=1 Tax=Candidatus Kaiserbacteria bacterium CG_4_8_14_3_um_filter_38_9 TaxID=1974599 RepID=A0A2M7IMY7_9BACT|nr:MAG: type II toxin-antitoxin system mRNA interferase toxin, RelE/StbE family [Candidatus Kaiserbacteria bacterium CG_4_8_14_3_um_filter_38_9]